jgi:hypothetical protein
MPKPVFEFQNNNEPHNEKIMEDFFKQPEKELV